MSQHTEELELIQESLLHQYTMMETEYGISERNRRDGLTGRNSNFPKDVRHRWNRIKSALVFVNRRLRDELDLIRMSDDEELEFSSHPSYGMVSLTSPQGQNNLFGSTIQHQHYMALHIHRAEIQRELHSDRFYQKTQLIEIAMSHAQWGMFLSSTGTTGVPCTITNINGVGTEPPPFYNKRSQFVDEFKIEMNRITSELRELEGGVIDQLKGKETLKRSDRDHIARKISNIVGTLSNHMTFIVDTWDESMENTINEAKVEVDTYINSIVKRVGLEGIKHDGALMLQLEHNEDRDK